MIWTREGIVEDQALSVSVLDRTFEHGLGLFETMRTWNGRVPLLGRHLRRIQNSAKELDLPLDPASLPGPGDVHALLEASGIEGDARLRLVASGGTPDGRPCVVWLALLAVDRFEDAPSASVSPVDSGLLLDPFGQAQDSELLDSRRHIRGSQTWISSWNSAASIPRSPRPSQDVWEGTRTNLFAVHRRQHGTKSGHPQLTALTPSCGESCGNWSWNRHELPGIPGGGDHSTMEEVSRPLTRCSSPTLSEGSCPWPHDSRSGRSRMDAPGPITKALWENHVRPWLENGGDTLITTIADVARWMESFAPSHLAESWDNVGLIVGDPTAPAGRS